MLLYHQLLNLHIEEYENVTKHIVSLDNLLMELKDVDATISSKLAAIALILSLPSSYQPAITALEVSHND